MKCKFRVVTRSLISHESMRAELTNRLYSHRLPRGCCVNAQGFSLHAEVRLGINQRHKLESQGQGWALLGAPRRQHLCRYITRPALANERLTLNRAGQVVLALKTPYRDGTTPIVMSPLEFMQRLAALVPRPRLHLI